MIRHGVYYCSVICCLLFSGCLSHHTERVADVDPLRWTPSDTLWVTYHNTDTLSKKEISIIVRHDRSFTEGVVETTVRTITPDSLVLDEPVTLNTASAGILHNNHFEAVIPYRTGNIFMHRGQYRFGFVPGRQYRGITAVGIRIDGEGNRQ